MKVCILMGSPRKQGNTNALLVPFRQELEALVIREKLDVDGLYTVLL